MLFDKLSGETKAHKVSFISKTGVIVRRVHCDIIEKK